MYLVFIMLDMHKIRNGVLNAFPVRLRRKASLFAADTDKFMGNYFRAQALVALIVGILYAIELRRWSPLSSESFMPSASA